MYVANKMAILAGLTILAVCSVVSSRTYTALDEYVWRPDDSYRWELIRTERGENATCTFYILNLISQSWYPGMINTLFCI